ncbi:hypothetical protein DITRI_Ditri04bG0068200 [Diplodiscus trichospermus]
MRWFLKTKLMMLNKSLTPLYTVLRVALWGKAKWPCIQDNIQTYYEDSSLYYSSLFEVWNSEYSSLKINVDGSALGKPGLAGIGGVLRDHLSNVKAFFSKSIGISDSNHAELLAIREAEGNQIADGLAKEVVHRLEAQMVVFDD